MLSISPRTLPPHPDFPEDEGAPTEPELRTVIAQLERLGARLVSVGHGRDRRSRLAAEHFAAVWNASTDRNGLDRSVAVIVDWAADAASWLKPARRLTEPGVDAWVISDTPHTWAQMSRRLRDSTNWDPGRTIALAALDTPLTIALAGANTLEGLRGASSDGRLWFVHDGRLIQHTPTQQKALMNSLLPRTAVEIAPGAIHVPDWLTLEQQRALVTACRDWAAGPAPMRHTRLPNGSTMSVQTVCLGWHWTPYKYTRAAVDQNDAPVTPFPNWLGELSRQALTDAYGSGPSVDTYKPDAALINFYDRHAKLGMHQDKDERTDAPVVSLSIGATCIFRFGNTENRNAPYTDIELRSGDLFVFGGPSRLAYHGVPRTIQAGTTNPDTGLTDARLNITVRDTGLSHAPPSQAAPIPAAD